MERKVTWRKAAACVAAVLVLAACGGAGEDKSGGDTAPVTLRLATDDRPGRVGAAHVEEFARLVDELWTGSCRSSRCGRRRGRTCPTGTR